MTASDIERASASGNGARGGSRDSEPVGEGRAAPARPSLHNKPGAPVLVSLPAPVTVRLAQLCWVFSLAVGAVAIVYSFVIRQAQMPEIVALIKGVELDRADATYETAADIVFWSIFGCMIAVVLVQIALLVSFSNRRPNIRWWQLGTVIFFAVVVVLAREVIAVGDRGVPLERIMLIQLGLAVLALLFSTLFGALKWTARRHDVRRAGDDSSDIGL